MKQLTIDDFLIDEEVKPELISFNMSWIGFHWIRITKGFVPREFQRLIDNEDNLGFTEIHTGTMLRDQIIAAFTRKFNGEVTIIDHFNVNQK
jgi:hypothetical protein